MTVKKIIDKFQNHGTLDNLKRTGRPNKLSDRKVREILKEVKNNPCSSAVKIAENISNSTSDPKQKVSASTVRRALHKNRLYGRVFSQEIAHFRKK